jgi:hypothetical protein
MAAFTPTYTRPVDPIKVEARRADRQPDLQADLARAHKLADFLDNQFSIGGYRFGVDALVGLIPGVGDLIGALAGVYPLMVAQRHGLGKLVQARMALNLLVEFAVGSIPVVGDLFDFGFKANIRNVRLLDRAVEKKAKAR